VPVVAASLAFPGIQKLKTTVGKPDMGTILMGTILPPGTEAPDFTLNVTPDQKLSLHEVQGRPVILAFYPADWSPVCGDEMALFNEVLPEFQKYGAELMGISVDGAWCHAACARHNNLHFPLLSDFEPKGAVARSYGAYRQQEGVCERALFVLDPERKVFWSYLSPIAVNPGADGILQALEDMKTRRSSDGTVESPSYAR
jgi:peroxiredoxin